MKESIKDLVKEYRLKRKITQNQLSQELNVSIQHIQAIEQGVRNPSTKLINNLIKVLKIPKNKLYIFLRLEEDNNFRR